MMIIIIRVVAMPGRSKKRGVVFSIPISCFAVKSVQQMWIVSSYQNMFPWEKLKKKTRCIAEREAHIATIQLQL